jgi:glycogen operon protein
MSLNEMIRHATQTWHGVKLGRPDWGDGSHSVAFGAELREERLLFHLIFNAYRDALDFELPSRLRDTPLAWRRWIDTSLAPPDDIVPWQNAPAIPADPYRAGPRSVVMLYAPTASPPPPP